MSNPPSPSKFVSPGAVEVEGCDSPYGTTSQLRSFPDSHQAADTDDMNRHSSVNQEDNSQEQPLIESVDDRRASRTSSGPYDDEQLRMSLSGMPTEAEDAGADGTASLPLTTLLLINNVIGGGILSLPIAFEQTSVIGGTFLLLFTTSITVLNFMFIVDAATAAEEYRFSTLVRNHFGKWAHIPLMALVFWPGGTVVAYQQIFCDAVPPVIKGFFSADPDSFIASRICWLLIGSVVFFAISARKYLADLLLPSMIGMVCILFSVVTIFIRYADGSYDAGGAYAAANYTQTSSDYKLFYVKPALFMALPVFAFALNVHSNAPHYFNNLANRTPARMLKANLYSHSFIITCYLAAAICGFMTFGPERITATSVHGNILNAYANDDTLMNITRICYAVVVLVSYPLLCMATRAGINQWVWGAVEFSYSFLVFETFLIVAITAVLGYFLPDLDELLAVLGSIFGVIVMFVTPSVLYLIVAAPKFEQQEREQQEKEKQDGGGQSEVAAIGGCTWKKVAAYFSIIFGILAPGICGLISTFDKDL